MSVIKVKNISKKYNSYIQNEINETIQENILSIIKNPSTIFKKQKKSDFWALKNISFNINKGDVLGIIGINGAGKSTLLKILSKITVPTIGKITIKGKISSLLEVGTGFNLELSGRDNIYLKGSIIGMERREIDKYFNDIVKFSGIKRFINMPAKKYSSGMLARLAFSVLSHLNSDILLIDEILSVGDLGFRKKCYEKINSIIKESGKTIVLVGHDMQAIKKLCNKCILLDEGEIKMNDKTDKVIEYYINKIESANNKKIEKIKDRKGEKNIWFNDIYITNNKNSKNIKSGDKLKIVIKYSSNYKEKIKNVRIFIGMFNEQGFCLAKFDNTLTKESIEIFENSGKIICKTGEINLEKGKYYFNIFIYKEGVLQDCVKNIVILKINDCYSKYNYINYEKYNIIYKKEHVPVLIKHSFYQ